MRPLDFERFTYLPENTPTQRARRDLDDVIRILARALAEHDRRPGGLRGGRGHA